MSWPCFLAERTDLARESLRRYKQADTPCPADSPRGYHNVSVVLGDVPYTKPWEGDATTPFPRDDPRWPTQCACGYVFLPEDNWQHNLTRLYRAPDGRLFDLGDAPVGAMWYAPWLTERLVRPRAEELIPGVYKGYLSIFYWRDWFGTRPPLFVQCPGRVAAWCVDQKSNNGDGWQVTGEPPNCTASPSIGMPAYHGWLRNGVLTDDVEGRAYQ